MARTDGTPAGGAGDLLRGALSLARDNLRLIVLLVCAIVFLALLGEVLEGEILRLDAMAYDLFVERLRSDALTPVVQGVTSLASVVVLAVMAAVIAALAPGKAPGWCVSVNLVCVVALNALLKAIVQRPRPEGFRLVAESGYSFPSGHSMVAMAFFGLLIWMIWRYHRRDAMRVVWCAFFGLVIVAVGLSRVYLGVHYASDVLAGFCVSLAWLALYAKIVAPLFLTMDAPRDGAPETGSQTGAES